jgi:four helix bundle protein
MYIYSFEKLEVWQVARKLTKQVYEVTGNYPAEERFGLVAQMRRAAVSVGSNIAEGATRSSAKDQAHFYQLAFGSLVELISQLILSTDLGFLKAESYESTRLLVEEVGNKINALRKAALKRINK